MIQPLTTNDTMGMLSRGGSTLGRSQGYNAFKRSGIGSLPQLKPTTGVAPQVVQSKIQQPLQPTRGIEPWFNYSGGYDAYMAKKNDYAGVAQKQPIEQPLLPEQTIPQVKTQPLQVNNQNLAPGEANIKAMMDSPAGIALQNNPAYINGTYEVRQQMWGELVANYNQGRDSGNLLNQRTI